MRTTIWWTSVALGALAACGGSTKGPPDFGSARTDAAVGADAGWRTDAAVHGDGGFLGCKATSDCPAGQYCQFRYDSALCEDPMRTGPGSIVCGGCTTPGTSVVRCHTGDPDNGEPCDPAEVPAGYSCRHTTCTFESLKTCTCTDGRWDCHVDARNFLGPNGEDVRPCGNPPICWVNCFWPPPGWDAGL